MAREDDNEKHGIRIPGSLLDQIRTKEDKGDYKDDNRYDENRFSGASSSRKRTQKSSMSRKDKRKEERKTKKQKTQKPHIGKQNTKSHAVSSKSGLNADVEDTSKVLKQLKDKKNVVSKKSSSDEVEESEDDFGGFSDDDELSEGDFDDDEDEEMDIEDTMAALKAAKDKKTKVKSKEPESAEDVFAALKAAKDKKNGKKSKTQEPETSDDVFTALKAAKESKNKQSKKSEDQSSEDVFAALKAAKDKKSKTKSKTEEPSTAEDVFAALKAAKEKKSVKKIEKKSKESKKSSKKESKESAKRPISAHERELMLRDEQDMAFYAKQLGLKNGSLKKDGEDDIIGGLFDGLDLDFGSEDEFPGEQSEDDLSDDAKADTNLPFSSDDELNSSDFDEGDLGSEDNEDGDDFGDSDTEKEPKKKENPYVAPAAAGAGRYIPPALRRQLENAAESEESIRLKRSIKGPLNRLSEANVGTIVNEISSLYFDNPRQSVTECITSIVLDSIVQQGRLLDTFVILHATVISAIYKIQGVEFGAYFIQTLVEKFEAFHQSSAENKGKEVSNVLSLLVSCYSFQIVSSKLLYDLIKVLISDVNELNSELLLRLVRNAGNQMRADDPTALKDIIIELTRNVAKLDPAKTNTRTKFLLEAITSLKNNKMKIANEQSQQLITKMKKFLGNLNNNKYNDPLHVSLDDIHNVKTRGKWWLVGSAWKGLDGATASKEESTQVSEVVVNDILDSSQPSWMELARAQRMNTDIRRAIFISIMSADDYLDAFTKLDKLNLKRSQEREIPKVLLHCAAVEQVWNPYYGVLAAKLCDNHSLRKTFQFALWDTLKEFDGTEDDEDEDDIGFTNQAEDDEEGKLRKVLNLGRCFGYLLSEGSIPLHVLKNFNFLTSSSDSFLFMEILLVSFLDLIGKKSEVSSVGTGMKKSKMSETRFDDKLLIERLAKTKEQSSLLRGLQFFLTNKVSKSDAISGKRQRKRVDWGIDSMCDIIDEFLRDDDN